MLIGLLARSAISQCLLAPSISGERPSEAADGAACCVDQSRRSSTQRRSATTRGIRTTTPRRIDARRYGARNACRPRLIEPLINTDVETAAACITVYMISVVSASSRCPFRLFPPRLVAQRSRVTDFTLAPSRLVRRICISRWSRSPDAESRCVECSCLRQRRRRLRRETNRAPSKYLFIGVVDLASLDVEFLAFPCTPPRSCLQPARHRRHCESDIRNAQM